jgi:CDP-glucose 4,6-dehydratase
VLDACRDLPSLKAIVSVTTDKCYLNNEWAYSYRENDPLGGADPYSASKACAEIVSSSWRASFFSKETNGRPAVALATARAGNVFGGGDWSEDRLIPDCSRAFLSNAPVQLRFPAAVRPWQFVLEPLAGYLMLAQALVEEGAPYAKAWNFGPRNEQLLTVGEVVDGFAAAWGQGASAEHQAQADAPHEAGLLLLDSGLANRELGWRPRLEVDEALEATARWYRAAHAGEDLIALSLEQIARFGTRSGGA